MGAKPEAEGFVAKSMFTVLADVGGFFALPMATADDDVHDREERAAVELRPEDHAMSRYATGQDAALAVVYDAIAGRLYSFFLRRCRDSSVSEDLVQQTFLHIHRARGSFVSGSPVLPWAFAIGRRLLIDWARKMQRARRVMVTTRDEDVPDRADAAANVEGIATARETERRLVRELERLPENQRVAFELLRIDGMSLLEASEVLGITVTALKLRAHRAYKALGLAHTQGGDP